MEEDRAPPTVTLAEILPGKHPSVRSAGAVCLQTLRPDVEMSNAFGRRVEVGGGAKAMTDGGFPILFCPMSPLHSPPKKNKSIWACEVEDSSTARLFPRMAPPTAATASCDWLARPPPSLCVSGQIANACQETLRSSFNHSSSQSGCCSATVCAPYR